MNIDLNKHVYPFFSKMFRSQRMERFINSFQVDSDSKILDVGGYPDNWLLTPTLPDVTLLNLRLPEIIDSRFKYIVADGTALPLKDDCFEIVYSNSVIEHLSNYENQKVFAREIQRVAKSYYIQTPNKYFPLEPHYLTLVIHWFPRQIQARLLKYFSLRTYMKNSDGKSINDLLSEINLLTKKEFLDLFEGSTLWTEKVLTLTKSLIAVSKDPKA